MSEDTPALFEVKTCRRCGKCKLLNQYYWRNGRGYENTCKACRCEASREYWRDPEAYRARRARPTPTGHKWCSRCNKCKPFSEFAPAIVRGNALPYAAACRVCVNAYNRERRKDPHIRASRVASWKRWHDNLDCNWSSKWRSNNLQRARLNGRRHQARRRALRKGLPSEPYTVEQVLERDGDCCVLCGRVLNLAVTHPHPMSVTIEHLECLSWPESAGDVLVNVGLSHFTCNVKRSTKPHPAAARKRAELLAAAHATSEPA